MKLRSILVLTAASASLHAQTFHRQAAIAGGGDREHGRCSIEMVVDGAAEIAVRGNDATVTNLKGRAPELTRFECTSPIPSNPAEFRFEGTGRGRVEMISAAQAGQAAVIRVEDPEDGADRYSITLSWRAGGPAMSQSGPINDGREPYRERQFTTEQAVEVCKENVRRQAADRFRTGDLTFRETHIDDAPGRSDWVLGNLEARSPGRPDQVVKFSCSVDFRTGQVRSAQIEPLYAEGGRPNGPVEAPVGAGMNPVATRNCRQAVEERARRDGYDRIQVGEIRPDDRAGRGTRLLGSLRAFDQGQPEEMRFNCSVDPRDGDVRSVDIVPFR